MTGNLEHDPSSNGGPTLSDADKRLASFIDRVVRLMDERKKSAKEFTDDIKEVVSEAKGNGYDSKLLRKTATEKLRRQNMDKDDLDEETELLRLYFRAAGLTSEEED